VIAIYVRVSTEEQATKGYSIDNQIEACIKKAGTSEVLKYVDEGYSGELLERPGLNKLREDIRKGMIEKVVCYDPDRLSRKLMNQLIIDDEIRKSGVRLEFVNGEYANTPEGQLFFSLRGAISEFEKAKIKERTSSGRRSKAKKGKVVKDSKIYGYVYDKEKETYVINEEEAKVVKMIFDYFTDQKFKGINGIAKHLTDIGIPTKRGAIAWHRQVVRQILMNEAYTGTYYQNKYDTEGIYVKRQAGESISQKLRPREEWIEMKIPAIISKEQFEIAQDLLSQGRRRYTNYGRHNYLLSGLVRCGRCGATMTGRRRLSHGKDFYIYDCRKNYAGAKTTGCGKQMSENKLNRIVWENVVGLLNNPEEMKQHQESDTKQYIYEELQHIKREIEKIKKGRKRLITLVSLDEELNIEEVKEQIKELQNKENQLQEQYNRLQEKVKEDDGINEAALQKAIDYFMENKEDITFEKKQKIIRMIVKEVVVVDSETVHIYTF
jgi:site-specific DNA recombinase